MGEGTSKGTAGGRRADIRTVTLVDLVETRGGKKRKKSSWESGGREGKYAKPFQKRKTSSIFGGTGQKKALNMRRGNRKKGSCLSSTQDH